MFGKKFKNENREKFSALIESGNNFSKQALQDYYRAMMQRPDRTDVLKKGSVPVLFVIGTDDGAAPMKDVLQQVHLPKIAYIHILEGIGHVSMLEAPEELNKYISDFITAIS